MRQTWNGYRSCSGGWNIYRVFTWLAFGAVSPLGGGFGTIYERTFPRGIWRGARITAMDHPQLQELVDAPMERLDVEY